MQNIKEMQNIKDKGPSYGLHFSFILSLEHVKHLSYCIKDEMLKCFVSSQIVIFDITKITSHDI